VSNIKNTLDLNRKINEFCNLVKNAGKLMKLANEAPEYLSGTIQRASTHPEMRIPNFMALLSQYNSSHYTKVRNFVLTLEVDRRNKVVVSDVMIVPSVGVEAQILPDLNGKIEELKKGIPDYFSKYPETINGIAAGTYTATYQIG
jgi:hypothetical protein